MEEAKQKQKKRDVLERVNNKIPAMSEPYQVQEINQREANDEDLMEFMEGDSNMVEASWSVNDSQKLRETNYVPIV